MHAASVVVSRQGGSYEIVFENPGQQAAVRLPRSLLIHLSREINRALDADQGDERGGGIPHKKPLHKDPENP